MVEKTKEVKVSVTKAVGPRAPRAHGVGRRKRAVARVWARRGTGKLKVNGVLHTKYFDTDLSAQTAVTPFKVCPMGANYDIQVNVRGGGKIAQADAVSLGISRAFVQIDEGLRVLLRKHGLLTVDARKKERKKYGQRGARAKFQFTKR